MVDKPWKVFERTVAKEFGTVRALQKGTGTKEDIVHPLFMVDCKLRKSWKISAWFRSLREAAHKKDKIPILVVRKPGKKLTYAVVELDILFSLTKGAGWVTTDDVIDADDVSAGVGRLDTATLK